MLYQVMYQNVKDKEKIAEYVVSSNEGSAELRADFKLLNRIKGGHLLGPMSDWECIKIKQMDDIPCRVDQSQIFYI